METNMNLDLNIKPLPPKKMDFKIGCIGAGFIMKDVQLVSYRNIGFNPIAITDKIVKKAEDAADIHKIPKVYETWEGLIKDKEIEILDIATPPHIQIDIIKNAGEENDHIKGILAQKPLAINYQQASDIVDICRKSNIKLAVNSNMRYDQSMRALI